MVSLNKKAYGMTIRNRVINSYKFIYSYVYICMLVWGSCTHVCVFTWDPEEGLISFGAAGHWFQ